jgi:uncharacterized NAD(P)/FAD-binding protein YdhS
VSPGEEQHKRVLHRGSSQTLAHSSNCTTKVGDAGRAGAVKIKDEKTGSVVTLQSSGGKEISEDEYKAVIVANASVQPPVAPSADPAQK